MHAHALYRDHHDPFLFHDHDPRRPLGPNGVMAHSQQDRCKALTLLGGSFIASSSLLLAVLSVPWLTPTRVVPTTTGSRTLGFSGSTGGLGSRRFFLLGCRAGRTGRRCFL